MTVDEFYRRLDNSCPVCKLRLECKYSEQISCPNEDFLASPDLSDRTHMFDMSLLPFKESWYVNFNFDNNTVSLWEDGEEYESECIAHTNCSTDTAFDLFRRPEQIKKYFLLT